MAERKRVVWNGNHFAVPPFTEAGQMEAGTLLRLLQQGETLGPPQAKLLPVIGPRCGELRVRDANTTGASCTTSTTTSL